MLYDEGSGERGDNDPSILAVGAQILSPTLLTNPPKMRPQDIAHAMDGELSQADRSSQGLPALPHPSTTGEVWPALSLTFS